jgi:hypothetical protein
LADLLAAEVGAVARAAPPPQRDEQKGESGVRSRRRSTEADGETLRLADGARLRADDTRSGPLAQLRGFCPRTDLDLVARWTARKSVGTPRGHAVSRRATTSLPVARGCARHELGLVRRGS